MKEKAPSLQLRALTDRDVPLFTRWLDAEHVKPWFTDPQSWIDEVNDRDGAYDWIHHYIIHRGGTPVGFCQYYPYWKSGEDWHGNLPLEGTYSIDYLIGAVENLQKGYAGATVGLLGRLIAEEKDAERIIVQPDTDNSASQNTLLSAGYRYDRENELFFLEL
ncbi:GNAT family N-acetyltransferase [Eubacterium sp. 1001713B170207_170306_E7]|uniref:GNAT family N-acetyltransferase n=1 Tax=Eubacterium sp. 1001713B170207_170306_E7 TaxID=2787097 RepID=UPI001897A083|nr:GNAT family N-acetyltransferase [Eubacterium sp. 1001713B170207_170306_E7]